MRPGHGLESSAAPRPDWSAADSLRACSRTGSSDSCCARRRRRCAPSGCSATGSSPASAPRFFARGIPDASVYLRARRRRRRSAARACRTSTSRSWRRAASSAPGGAGTRCCGAIPWLDRLIDRPLHVRCGRARGDQLGLRAHVRAGPRRACTSASARASTGSARWRHPGCDGERRRAGSCCAGPTAGRRRRRATRRTSASWRGCEVAAVVALGVHVLRSAAGAARRRRLREADLRAGARRGCGSRTASAPTAGRTPCGGSRGACPEEEPAARFALDLQRRLPRAPQAPFAEVLPGAAAPDPARRRR